MFYKSEFNILYGDELRGLLIKNDEKIKSHIEQETESYILNVNENEYKKYLIDKYTVDIPILDFENVTVSKYERNIPAEQFPMGYNVRSGNSYPKPIIVFHIPVSGNCDLLTYRPDQYLMWNQKMYLEGDTLNFEIISFNDDSEEIKRNANHIIENLKKMYSFFVNQITKYNIGLEQQIQNQIQGRKKKLLDQNKLLESLNVPIKKQEDLASTYAIPTPQIRKSVYAKPPASATPYSPEPTIDLSTYTDILQTIHDVGKVIERFPSIYQGKDEESLRDYILMYLEPRYEGSATGETFNKTGKTDILIRHENSNVFIAECLFWQGSKHYLGKISQLLKYLTWRDSKSAVIVFVGNKDISSVLKSIEENTPSHPNYLGIINKKEESWINYRFHIDGDPSREVKCAVLLFHLPRI